MTFGHSVVKSAVQTACIPCTTTVSLQQLLTATQADSVGTVRGVVVMEDVTAGQLLAVCNPLVYARVQPSDFADHPQLKMMSMVCTYAISRLVLVCGSLPTVCSQ